MPATAQTAAAPTATAHTAAAPTTAVAAVATATAPAAGTPQGLAPHGLAPQGAAPYGGGVPGGVAVVVGTRPELVKVTELLRILGPEARLIHTGQHYDDELSGRFLTELGLPEPTYLTGVGGRTRAGQLATALDQLDALFAERPPAAVVVQGDTNAALAGALAANARGIRLVHIEAGLRSHDRAMPEEHNRVLIDRLADLLCAPTSANRAALLAEGVPDERIVVTGNTVVEAVREHLPDAAERAALRARFGEGLAGCAGSAGPASVAGSAGSVEGAGAAVGSGLVADRYVLATVHRPENTDSAEALRAILDELGTLAADGTPVLLPLHPRTRARIEAAGLGGLLAPLIVSAPLGYREFLGLARDAALVVSDSGGVQEEVTVLGRPLVVVRRSTERGESLRDFASLVAPGPAVGVAARRWLAAGPAGLARLASLPSPFGDGFASRRIAELAVRVAV